MQKYVTLKDIQKILSPHFHVPENISSLTLKCYTDRPCELSLTSNPRHKTPEEEDIPSKESSIPMKNFTFCVSGISTEAILGTITENSAKNHFHILVPSLYRDDILKVLNNNSTNKNTE